MLSAGPNPQREHIDKRRRRRYILPFFFLLLLLLGHVTRT
jgi:hypothetical protein